MTINAMCLGGSEKHTGFSLSKKNKNFQTESNIARLEAIYSICALGMNSTSCLGKKSSSQRRILSDLGNSLLESCS